MTICHAFAHTQIYIGIEIDYIEQTIGLEWIKRFNEISKMINRLSNYHKSKVNST